MASKQKSLALGVDLGGTKTLTAVVDADGNIISEVLKPTPAALGKDAVVQVIMESLQDALDQADQKMEDITAIGVGAPGPSNPQLGILHTSPNLPGWRDVPIRDIVAKASGRDTFLINDANAAALAEYHFGAGRDTCCFIYVTVSTGIGGGIVLGGEIYTGARGLAAEIGHITIDDHGPPCNCGNSGCWESLASGTALANRARHRLMKDKQSAIADGRTESITAEHVFKAAEAGDALALELIEITAYYLGTGFASLINIFNPDVIAIGGGMSRMGRMLLEPAYITAQKRSFAKAYETVRFTLAQLGQNSGVLGAAVYALRQAG